MEAEKQDRARAVSAAVRAHYLSLPGKTEEGWFEVLLSPIKYNKVWRHMLKHTCDQTDLEVNGFPPPIHLQHIIP